MHRSDAHTAEVHPYDLVLPTRILDLRPVPPLLVDGLQSADEEMLHFHAFEPAVLDVLDGVHEAWHHIGDLRTELLVDLAVQGVDDGSVLRFDPAAGGDPV